MKIKILHLYPDLLNLYGDKGNIECLKHRLEWRNIEAEIITCTSDNNIIDFSDIDIFFIGGGSDREQKIVCEKLLKHKDKLKDYVENNGTVLAVCGAYQLLGKYYKMKDETINGLEILDIYTEQGKDRLISNIVIKSDLISMPIVGFENHSGRTYIGNHTPLGKVVCGTGNNEEKQYEGVVYKNVVATYLHGPLLPKNPQLCDYILTQALKKKYPDFDTLTPLDDGIEIRANEYLVERFTK